MTNNVKPVKTPQKTVLSVKEKTDYHQAKTAHVNLGISIKQMNKTAKNAIKTNAKNVKTTQNNAQFVNKIEKILPSVPVPPASSNKTVNVSLVNTLAKPVHKPPQTVFNAYNKKIDSPSSQPVNANPDTTKLTKNAKNVPFNAKNAKILKKIVLPVSKIPPET